MVDDGALVIRRRGVRMDVAGSALAAVRPWRLPLPAPGVAFVLTSGRRLGVTLVPADLAAFLHAVAAVGVGAAHSVSTDSSGWGRTCIRSRHTGARPPSISLLYASLLRTAAEAANLGAAWVTPERPGRVRGAAEVAVRLLYYAGVLLLRFAPWE